VSQYLLVWKLISFEFEKPTVWPAHAINIATHALASTYRIAVAVTVTDSVSNEYHRFISGFCSRCNTDEYEFAEAIPSLIR
jgi:hypothetical protein